MSEVSIPKDWNCEKISDFTLTKSGGTPSTFEKKFWENGNIPWLPSGELKNNVISKANIFITKLGLKNSAAILYPKETVLIALTGATTGKIGYLTFESSGNQSITGIYPNNKYYSKYLYYYLQFIYEKILLHSTGSAQPHINKNIVDKLDILKPKSLKEQEKIANILTTIDNTIEKTQEIIDKNKKIKDGLMQDLFTPKDDWEEKKLGEIGYFKNGVNKGKDDFGFGIKFVNIIDAYPLRLQYKNLGRINVDYNEIKTYKLEKGDLIFVRSSVSPEGVGYNTLFDEYKEDVVYCGFMIRFRIYNKEEYLPIFYNYYFRSQEFRKKVINCATVSANSNVNQENLKKLITYKLPITEQERIANILSSIDNKIEKEETYLNKLHKIKVGLMQDLLTGNKKVRL